MGTHEPRQSAPDQALLPTLALSDPSPAASPSAPPPTAGDGTWPLPDARFDSAALASAAGGSSAPTALPLAPAPADADDTPRHYEHYEVLTREDGALHELGRGAMGVTYKARDTRLHCPVALKVIHPTLLAQHPALRERFLQEARAAARLRHPNVASVFHLGEREEDGACFYAMEFIAGETLEARVRHRGPLPPLLALEVAQQVTRALIGASQEGLIHRDLKPSNLMLISDTQDHPGGVLVKVIDFGLVKVAADNLGLTECGGFVGTPQFASPEQISSDAPAPPDARSDIYSLGATLWYALTGKAPYPGRNLSEILHRQQGGELPTGQLQAAGVPAPVITLLRSMLAVRPDDRPATPYALAEAVRFCREALGGGSSAGTHLPAGRHTDIPGLPPPPPRRRFGRRSLLVIAGVVLMEAVGITALLKFGARQATHPEGPPAPAAPVVAERSIAVLPFDNLSAEPDNAFFAVGIQDDLLTSLAQIGDLKVISRTSVRQYGARNGGGEGSGATRNLREIGQALGVANILEGSVRRAGNRVRVVVQLIDARTDRHLWASTYDRELSDALTLQSELAREIAAALQATLSPEEDARMGRKPTGNADAYVLFLRGRDYQTRPDILLQNLQTAELLFEQAVTLDPAFALAWARLSQTRSQRAFNYEPTDERAAEARAAADQALRLRPDLGETHLALGLCHYWCERDYDRALAELDLAVRALPNDPEAPRAIANIRRRQGRWDEALAGYQRALALSPRDFPLMNSLARLHSDRRDWPKAIQALDRALALRPDSVNASLYRASFYLHWKGDLAPLKNTLAVIPPGVDPEGIVSFYRFDVACMERDFAGAERVLAECPLETLRLGVSTPVHKSYLQGLIPALRRAPGDAARAQACFQAARPHYEAAVRQFPRDALRHADLGLLYAELGWKEAAVAEGQRAVALSPESQDAVNGTAATLRLAKIHARLGDPGRALPLLEHLLTAPVHEWNSFSFNDLRLNPMWDPLRADPRFERLLRSAAAQAK